MRFRERRYPLEMSSSFACSDSRLNEIQPILLRGMQMCANETYMDCPYYEELMYTGDTRLEALVTYLIANDDRLPRKAIRRAGARLRSGHSEAARRVRHRLSQAGLGTSGPRGRP